MGALMCCSAKNNCSTPNYDKIPCTLQSNGDADDKVIEEEDEEEDDDTENGMGEIQLSETELTELKDIFAMFDKDNSGSIDITELEAMVSSLGINATKEDLSDMITEADIDGSGTIEFNEFKLLIGPHFQKEKPPEDYIDAFKFFDKDGDGYISRTELRHIMNTVDSDLAEVDIEEMIKEADTNGDGKIDFDEFIKMMHHQ